MTYVRLHQPQDDQQPEHEAPEKPREPQPKHRTSLLTSRVTPGMAVAVIGAIVVLRLFVVETGIVEGRSMMNTLEPGNRILVLKPMEPRRYDVVLLTDPQTGLTDVKRVIGLPGDTVALVPEVSRGPAGEITVLSTQLYLNGQLYREPYVSSPSLMPVSPTKLDRDSYFVLGDNRAISVDSATYGPIKRDRIRGVAVAVILPPQRVRWLLGSAEPAAPVRGEAFQ